MENSHRWLLLPSFSFNISWTACSLLIVLTHENNTTFFCMCHAETEQAKFSTREAKSNITLKKLESYNVHFKLSQFL